jgi:hypothetical protein
MSTTPTTASEINSGEYIEIEPPSNIHKLETSEIPLGRDQHDAITVMHGSVLAP